MKEFFLSNWQIFAAILCGIIELVIFIILKRRPQLVDNSLIVHILEWINKAESTFKLGTDKKQFVLDQAKKYLGSNYCEKDVSLLIEYVLTSPQKKEVHL